MKTADEFLTEGAATFKAKNAVYGNNYLNVGRAMVAMFPDGVTISSADDWNRLHIFLLGVVKLTRYANNWDDGGHADSMHDNTVYSAMLESIDAEILERKRRSEGTQVTKSWCPLSTREFKLCEGCSSPQTCTAERLCLSIIRSELSLPFAVCNDCVNITMCSHEKHCDRIFNGYR